MAGEQTRQRQERGRRPAALAAGAGWKRDDPRPQQGGTPRENEPEKGSVEEAHAAEFADRDWTFRDYDPFEDAVRTLVRLPK